MIDSWNDDWLKPHLPLLICILMKILRNPTLVPNAPYNRINALAIVCSVRVLGDNDDGIMHCWVWKLDLFN